VDADDADASGYEPVWRVGKRVGYITSGGYGHHLGKSLAMALVDVEHAEAASGLTAHIVGAERGVEIIADSPYDPKGERMRLG
jgi:dimethylglycine dehydrogenase